MTITTKNVYAWRQKHVSAHQRRETTEGQSPNLAHAPAVPSYSTNRAFPQVAGGEAVVAARSNRNLVGRRSVGFLANNDLPCKTDPEFHHMSLILHQRAKVHSSSSIIISAPCTCAICAFRRAVRV